MSFSGLLFISGMYGCQSSDVGQCCEVLPGKDQSLIPPPSECTEVAGDLMCLDDVRVDPAFDCEFLACVSYKGSAAFCTKSCEFDDSCPDGFECQPVLQAAGCDYNNSTPSTDDDCKDGQLTPNDRFCVKAAHACEAR